MGRGGPLGPPRAGSSARPAPRRRPEPVRRNLTADELTTVARALGLRSCLDLLELAEDERAGKAGR